MVKFALVKFALVLCRAAPLPAAAQAVARAAEVPALTEGPTVDRDGNVIGEMTGDPLDDKLGVAIAADGAATMISTVAGGPATTTYAENIGVMAATRVYSTAAYMCAAFFALLAFYLVEAAEERRRNWLYFASGLAAGAGVMSHTNIIYILGALCLLMLMREGLRCFTSAPLWRPKRSPTVPPFTLMVLSSWAAKSFPIEPRLRFTVLPENACNESPIDPSSSVTVVSSSSS